jgi:hypothetical protein
LTSMTRMVLFRHQNGLRQRWRRYQWKPGINFNAHAQSGINSKTAPARRARSPGSATPMHVTHAACVKLRGPAMRSNDDRGYRRWA